MEKFEVNQKVTYIGYVGAPPEHGVVSSIIENPDGSQKVWVKFKGPTGELTPTDKLR